MTDYVPVLIDIDQLAQLLNRSVGSLERDQASGRIPAPVYIGASRRWRRGEVLAWVAAGCPGGALSAGGRGSADGR